MGIAAEMHGLCVRELGCVVGGKRLLGGVNFELSPGVVIGVLGPNGAGKSTLLKLLAGQWKPTEGEIRWSDRPLPQWRPEELACRRAVLPQQSSTPFDFTALEIVLMGRLPFRDAARQRELALRAMRWTESEQLAGRVVRHLSGGELQRVHLARVLVQLGLGESGGAQLLLLDEPVSNLDPAHQHQTLQICRHMAARGVAVLVILHDLNLAANYCDRLLLLQSGTPVCEGTPEGVLNAGTLRDVFQLNSHQLINPLSMKPTFVFSPLSSLAEV